MDAVSSFLCPPQLWENWEVLELDQDFILKIHKLNDKRNLIKGACHSQNTLFMVLNGRMFLCQPINVPSREVTPTYKLHMP